MSQYRSIRLLPDNVINRIAAGEVVERPAGAIKELLENAIDAGADRISVIVHEGGKALFIVEDNGHGIPKTDLAMALQRHATSKLYADDTGETDLVYIQHFGFRGEALASLASVSDLSLVSFHETYPKHAYEITAQAGAVGEVKPASLTKGTRITVKNLFYPVPARLKFLKSDRSEQSAVIDTVKRIAMAHPQIGFLLRDEEKILLRLNAVTADLFDGRLKRLADITGDEFALNAMVIDTKREGVTLEGLASLPTYHRGNGLQQYLYVNGRSVKDKMLSGVLRAAYAEHLGRDRYPICALFLTLPHEDVDVNVHPTKAEVRFRDADNVRGLMITAIRHAIAQIGFKTSQHNTQKTLSVMAQAPLQDSIKDYVAEKASTLPIIRQNFVPQSRLPLSVPKPHVHYTKPLQMPESKPLAPEEESNDIPPLGYAKGQVHQTYIISQTGDGIIIVDQHAAHERIILELVKEGLKKGGLTPQNLLVPDIIALPQDAIEDLLHHTDSLKEFGLILESFGTGQILVRAVPAFLIGGNIAGMVKDLADDVADGRGLDSLSEKINLICATFACHHSIRAGRSLSIEEMNALLRQMEKTVGSGQCNHGRPTYIALGKSDIEKLFGRK